MSSLDRRATRRAEIERDHRLVTATLTGALRQILRNTETARADPELLWQHLQSALTASRETYRQLDNARINLRARRGTMFDDSLPLPGALSHYRHRGNYRGEFRSMAVLGAVLSRSRDPLDATPRPRDPAGFAEELHLRGELWTFEHEDSIHVFTTPRSPSDAALARLRPPLTIAHVCNESNLPPL